MVEGRREGGEGCVGVKKQSSGVYIMAPALKWREKKKKKKMATIYWLCVGSSNLIGHPQAINVRESARGLISARITYYERNNNACGSPNLECKTLPAAKPAPELWPTSAVDLAVFLAF